MKPTAEYISEFPFASEKNAPPEKNSVSCRAAVEGTGSDVFLSDVDRGQEPWDVHKIEADTVMQLYAFLEEFENYARRISQCAGILKFGWLDDLEGGRLKLTHASFCRVRHCPVCQWRRSMTWLAKFYSALPAIKEKYPKARWVLLTLTVRNCEIEELRNTLWKMGKAWTKLIKREEFKSILGWVRTVEVTQSRDGGAHPHFHVLLMVKPSYFTTGYVKQSRWTELWKECLGVDYTPVVNVKAVKCRVGQSDPVEGAVVEVLKYAVKPSDMTSNREWFYELTRQLHHLRFVASGGFLKNIFKKPKDDEMISPESEEQPRQPGELCFEWKRLKKRYTKI